MIFILCIIHIHYIEQLYEFFVMEIRVNKYTYIHYRKVHTRMSHPSVVQEIAFPLTIQTYKDSNNFFLKYRNLDFCQDQLAIHKLDKS